MEGTDISRPKLTKTANILWGLILIGILAFLYFKFATPKNTIESSMPKREISLAGNNFWVYEALTQIEKETGLSKFYSIPENQGMLFYFDSLGRPAFWMKDMQFPIDIIWMRDYTVVQIDKNIPVEKTNAHVSYLPASDINQVLELKAGMADKSNIKIGDVLQLK